MKISTKGRYALRLMLDIAMHDAAGPVRIKDVAARQEISDKYLEQIVSVLNKAGYVRSIRGLQGGAKGGYSLAKPKNEISVGDVLRALEGDLAPVNCSEVIENGSPCKESKQCVSKLVWQRISESINNAVDSLMISDLLEESNSDKICGCQ